MNLGMQETGNLAWKLKLVLEGNASESLLDTFNEERYPIVKDIFKWTDFGTKIFFSKNVLLRKFKKIIFSVADYSKKIKKRLNKAMSGVLTDYGFSSIVSENWKGNKGIDAGECKKSKRT